MQSKKELVELLEAKRCLYNSCVELQKKEDDKTDKKLEEYRQKNNLQFDYIPEAKEWEENIWSLEYSQEYKDSIKIQKSILRELPELMEKLTWNKMQPLSWYRIMEALNKEFGKQNKLIIN